mgnify:CR=1 FL=1
MIFSKEFFSFIFAGGIAALANFLSRIFLNNFFSFSISIFIAYCNAMLIAYFLMKLFVFKSSNTTYFKSSLYFIIINLLAVIQTLIVSLFLANFFLPSLNIQNNIYEIAHAVGIIIPVITSYYGHKFITFK